MTVIFFFSNVRPHGSRSDFHPVRTSYKPSPVHELLLMSKFRNYKITRVFCPFTGRPEPNVKWWRGETLMDNGNDGISHQYSSGYASVKENKLTISSLGRNDQGAVYTCQASNSIMSPPVSASITIEMFRKSN